MIKFKEKKDVMEMYITLISVGAIGLYALLMIAATILKFFYNYDVTGIVIVAVCLMMIGFAALLFDIAR